MRQSVLRERGGQVGWLAGWLAGLLDGWPAGRKVIDEPCTASVAVESPGSV